jgi:Dolichyl-phosphate-mannose-protein mannosyltransferase
MLKVGAMSALKPWHRAILVIAVAGLAVSLLAWIARRDPAINFLPGDRGAEWIVFPAAPDARAHWFASFDTTFRREFFLPEQTKTASLSVRAMRRAEVKVNGVSIQLPHNRNWKHASDVAIAEELREGANIVEVRVFNHNGPPALWLRLDADHFDLHTDEGWEASCGDSSWHHAALASTAKIPGPGNSIGNGPRTWDTMKNNLPVWIVLVVIATVAFLLWRVVFNKSTKARLEQALVVVLAGFWLLLFWNNTRLLPFHAGFDAGEHLKYIEYIQKNWSLPLPTEGWEMYQPPLYYFIAAVILSLCKLSINDPASVSVLRSLGPFCGIAQFVFVFLSLRLLLPLRTTLIGLLMAACLPMHLYMAHYVTNENLAATLATLTIYLCLRLLRSDTQNVWQFVLVGFALGAAMLAKATIILLLPVVVAAIVAKLLQARAPIAISLRNVSLLLVICLAVCGWHYGRIWLRYGTPLLGNWDVVSGFRWWQNPGYHTVTDYFRFGRSLIAPLFSGFAGVGDGIYSTLWGDGLCGGASSLSIAWNQQPLVAGYLWALIPTALIVIGAVVAIIQFVRKPSSELFLLLGFSAVLMLGLIFMTLKIPSYAQAKAFYGLSALTPLCFFGALGWEAPTHASERLGFVLGTLVLVWAMNSFATYWITPSVAQHLYAAKALATRGQIDRASVEAARAVEVDPLNATARSLHALSLNELGDDEKAIKEAERASELNPTDSGAHLALAICVRRSDRERAIAEARRAIELGPENSSAYQFLMNCLFESGRYNEAADLGREWLAVVSPFDVAAHSSVAVATAQTGDLVTAARQLGYVLMLRPNAEEALAQLHQIVLSLAKAPDGLQRLHDIATNAPDSPRMLDELAWLLATYPDSNSRDGAEAVRLAGRACELTDRRVPALLATLAAAYAEAGDFPRSTATGEEALSEARSLGDTDGIKLSENILASVRANVPYRHEPDQ